MFEFYFNLDFDAIVIDKQYIKKWFIYDRYTKQFSSYYTSSVIHICKLVGKIRFEDCKTCFFYNFCYINNFRKKGDFVIFELISDLCQVFIDLKSHDIEVTILHEKGDIFESKTLYIEYKGINLEKIFKNADV
ncbi:MAG: hypothetical protein QXX12_06655 [Nanopusillaceae archaeon]